MLEPIVCLCPHCDAKLKLKNPELAGKKIKCPKCAEPFVVTPDETDVTKPARRAAKPPEPKTPAEDDWLSDLGDTGVSEDKLPPVIKKKKKATVPGEIRERKRSEEGRELSLPMHYVMMGVTGLVGGLIGAAIWAALIYFTGVEIGYVAILVGACAGIGVRLGASQWDFGMGPGLLAVAVAIVALIGGKVVGGRMYLNKELGEIRALAMQFQHDNHLIAEMADEIWEDSPEGTPLSNPELEDGEYDTPEQIPNTYPKEVWEQALAKWNALTEPEKQKLRDDQAQQFNAEFEIPAEALFGPIDVLWFFLAVGAAFRIATGEGGD